KPPPVGVIWLMPRFDHSATESKTASSERLLVAAHLHDIEGNPLDSEQIAMFAMFEREGWSDDRILAHLHARAAATRGAQAAE
ncbi:MAG: hypothetical protein Q8S58_16620, partial [Bosea sp. (in: a-proteobacteria)]|nr:hypothetical protein [Bosea sp. (in: a-proteobacteria)]